MARPVLHFGNLFSDGTLVSSEDATTNPVRRIADGSINLDYFVGVISGGANMEVVQVTLPTAARAVALVINQAAIPVGTSLVVESFDIGGGNLVKHLDETGAGATFITTLSGVVADRQEWRLTISGAGVGSGVSAWRAAEIQLTTGRLEVERPQVGVGRVRVRQFGRLEVPHGQPFVRRRGPRLRRMSYSFQLIDGSQVTDMEDFVDAVEGGQAFGLVDDEGSRMWAELLGGGIGFDDQAGVRAAQFTFQEIRRD